MTIVIIVAVLGLLAYAAAEKLHALHIRRQTVGTVTVTLTADTSGFEDAMRRMSRDFGELQAKVGDRLAPAMRGMGDAFVGFARKMQVWQIGVETKWWMRGALYASLGYPDSCVNVEVQRALTEELLFPTQAATAFMRGWVENRPVPVDAERERVLALPLDPHPIHDELVTP